MEMESSLALFLSQKAAFGVVMIILSFILWQYLVFLGKMRGPLLSQLLETLVNFFVNMNDIYDWITQLIQRYGGSLKLKSHWMGFSFVTTDPKHIEYIVKTKFSSFPKGRYFKSIFLELMGDGILTADGEEWVSVRKMMSSVFHSPAFKRKLIDTMDVLANSRLVAVLEHASRSASALDIQHNLCGKSWFYSHSHKCFRCRFNKNHCRKSCIVNIYEAKSHAKYSNTPTYKEQCKLS
jgi:hypothetical protein